MSVLKERVLVLNRSWRPIRFTSVRSAVTRVYQGSARIVDPRTFATHGFESWRDAAAFARDTARSLLGAGWTMAVLEVIVIGRYDGHRPGQARFTRRNIYKRDRNTCQYCGVRPGTSELTIDHIMPRSRGGKSTWENCVLACVRCNRRKADRTPRECNMFLAREPKAPRWTPVLSVPLARVRQSWEKFIDQRYWDVLLEP